MCYNVWKCIKISCFKSGTLYYKDKPAKYWFHNYAVNVTYSRIYGMLIAYNLFKCTLILLCFE